MELTQNEVLLACALALALLVARDLSNRFVADLRRMIEQEREGDEG